MSKDVSSLIVFAGSAIEAAMVQSFLESNGIPAELIDEHVGTMAAHIAAPGGAGAVKVAVAASDAAKAKTFLAEHARDV
jgi:hypothetical protein